MQRRSITRCVQFALERLGIEVADPEVLTPFIGPPLAESFARFYGLDAEQAHCAIGHYRERFVEAGLYENAVYPGVPNLLRVLSDAGITLAVATAKPTPFAEQILVHFGLDAHFRAVAGASLDQTRVSKGDVIAHALTLLPEHNRERTVMIGDREHDIIRARAHGIGTIAAGYGYGSAEELHGAAPLAIAATVAELGELLGLQRPAARSPQ
jgi:phosphoglycolate phosphatase